MYEILSNKYYRNTSKYSKKSGTTNLLTEYTILNNKRQTTVGKKETMNCDGLNYSDTLQSNLFN